MLFFLEMSLRNRFKTNEINVNDNELAKRHLKY